MSQWTENSHDLHELAQLPALDPRRRELEDRLPMMTPAERAYWSEQLRQTDQLYVQLSTIGLNRDLERRLLQIPDQVVQPAWRKLMHQPVGWGHLAAAIAMLSLLTGILVWSMQSPRPTDIPPLNGQIADAIAAMAISHHSAPVQFAGDNPAEIQNALTQMKLPFAPVVPRPSTVLTLRGGGVFKYHSTPVAFTRWTGDDVSYTLYQFKGTNLGVPPVFASTTDAPSNANGYRVAEWTGAGGQCTWALVMESAKATDVFSSGCN